MPARATKPFLKGNTEASKQKGKKRKSTLVKEALGLQNIEDLKPEVLKVWNSFIKSKDKKAQGYAAKEISKYIFAQKREHTGEFKANLKVVFENIKK